MRLHDKYYVKAEIGLIERQRRIKCSCSDHSIPFAIDCNKCMLAFPHKPLNKCCGSTVFRRSLV